MLGAAIGLSLGMLAPEPAALSAEDAVAAALESRYLADVQPLLAQYCFDCHGDRRPKAGVDLESLLSIESMLASAEDLVIARELVISQDMPPEDEPAPTPHERLLITSWIDDVLDYHPADAEIDPGWFTIHRLNRSEYRNTLRDLLFLDTSEDLAAGLPPDDTGYGFDNIADVLSVSTLQVEAYLSAAERAVELALGPEFEESEEVVTVPMTDIGYKGRRLDRGGSFLITTAEVSGKVQVPVAGVYEIGIEAWGTRGGDHLPRASLRLDGEEVGSFEIEARRGASEIHTVRRMLRSGEHTVSARFMNDYYRPPNEDRNLAVEALTIAGPLPGTATERPRGYRELFFVQPGDDDGHGGRLDEEGAATRVLRRFAERAFRGPVADAELRGLLGLYAEARKLGDSHEQAVRLAFTASLVSPRFLYRTVANSASEDPTAIYRLEPFELASRLSYFLWSSMPDEQLRGVAESGELAKPGVLREQARRMLSDPRAEAFVENFTGQWLLLRNLDGMELDAERFSAFDEPLRRSMEAEAMLCFADVLRGDRPVTDLIDSDSTYLDERLARHYGIDGVVGEHFRRVDLPPGSPRGGVLTTGAVLTVTSNPTRSSPVKRGLFVLDELLGMPPPPPPPDIPPLEQAAREAGHGATLREQLALHVSDPTCAACHRRMDPIGLAMENFDAIGRWRDEDEEGRAIDSAGELPDGSSFDGPADLKRVLLARQDRFLENLTKRLLTYALGRGVEPFDRPTVHAVISRAGGSESRLSTLIEEIVVSEAFRTCRGRALAGDAQGRGNDDG